MSIRRAAIVGAGAMGCLFAARLAGAGAEVTLIDVDEERLGALRERGVMLRDDAGEHHAPVHACPAGEARGPFELVLILTKGPHTAAASASVAHLAADDPVLLTLQNGLGNADIIAGTFGPDRLLHGVADLPADLEGPAQVVSHGGGHVRFGGYCPAAHAFAAPVADLFRRGGIDARVEEDIDVAIWEKLAFNAALNSVGAVTGFANGAVAGTPARNVAYAIAREVMETAAAAGVAVDRVRVTDRIGYALAHHGGHRASMLQDMLAGRPTEVDSINGAVVAAAEKAGHAAPVTAALADLVRALEARPRG